MEINANWSLHEANIAFLERVVTLKVVKAYNTGDKVTVDLAKGLVNWIKNN